MKANKFKQKIELLTAKDGTQYQWLTNGTLITSGMGRFINKSKTEITAADRETYPRPKK